MPEQNQLRPKWQLQFMQFAGVGVIGTVAHYVLLVMLVEAFGANAVAASTAGATSEVKARPVYLIDEYTDLDTKIGD